MNRSQLRASTMAPKRRRSTFVQGSRPGTIRALKALSPGVLPPPPERPAPLPQDRHHPPEMLHLLGRERRGALHELGIVGIVAGERQGVHGHLLLADRMIGEELGKIRRRELRP